MMVTDGRAAVNPFPGLPDCVSPPLPLQSPSNSGDLKHWPSVEVTGTKQVHEISARYGKSKLIILRRGKSFEEATVMDNDILEGGKVLSFFETPHGLIAVGEGSVGLIEGSP